MMKGMTLSLIHKFMLYNAFDFLPLSSSNMDPFVD
jgi:hypothetical protein